MSRESVTTKVQSNVTFITLSDDDDDDEVKIIDQKENVSTMDGDIKVVFEKDRDFSIIKTIEYHTIDDTSSDLSFGANSLIEPPVKLNKTLESHEAVEIEMIKEKITIRQLETPRKVKADIKEEITEPVETHQKFKLDIKKEEIKKPLKTNQKLKTDIKEEEEEITKPVETHKKLKLDIKKEEIKKPLEIHKEFKFNIKKEEITKPVETHNKFKLDIKKEEIKKPLETHKKFQFDIKKEEIKKPLEGHQKIKTDIKEDIDKNFKTDCDSKKNLIKLENPNSSTNKRKKLDCNDKKISVLHEIKPKNIKVEQTFTDRSHCNCVINPKNKKFKNETKLEDINPDTSLAKENSGEDLLTSMFNNTSSQSQPSKKRLKIMFTGINYEEYKNSLSTIGGLIVTNASIADILVTDQIRRKFKFTLAIARGIPIVSIQWIKTSIDSKKFQDPSSYIFKDIRFEREYNFNLRDSLIKAQKKLIFDNYTFIITRNVHPTFSDLSELIRVSGGVTLVNAPKIWKDHTFIVSCEQDLSSARRKKINSPKKSIVPIVEASFITDSIWKQNINIKDNLLSY